MRVLEDSVQFETSRTEATEDLSLNLDRTDDILPGSLLDFYPQSLLLLLEGLLIGKSVLLEQVSILIVPMLQNCPPRVHPDLLVVLGQDVVHLVVIGRRWTVSHEIITA